MHGKLIHVSCIFPLIWPFLHGLAHFPLSFRSPCGKLQVPPPLYADLSWIQFVLQSLPNEIPLAPAAPIDLQWWGDASTLFRIGIIIGSYWAVWKWAPSFKVGPWQDFDIGWAEAIAVELGLQLALSLSIVGNGKLGGHTLLVQSDNAGIIAVTNKGWSHSHKTNRILKHVYALQAQNHLCLNYSCSEPFQHFQYSLSRCNQGVPGGFPFSEYPSFGSSPRSPIRQIDIIVNPVSAMVSNPLANDVLSWNLISSQLQLNPSPLQPNCQAEDSIFMWKGINSSPATTIDHPAICFLANLASQASL
jgi:hypothetical protein